MRHEEITLLLTKEVAPALGCTGPTAYALAAARCRPLLTAEPLSLTLTLSPAFFKTGFGVATPGSPEPGIPIAGSLGLWGGDYTRGMEVLSTATEEDMKKARAFVQEGKVRVCCDWTQEGVYSLARVDTQKESVEALVAGTHDSIVYVAVNGKTVLQRPIPSNSANIDTSTLDPDSILDYIKKISLSHIAFLEKGVNMNLSLAEDGLRVKYGHGIGRALDLAMAKKEGDRNDPADLSATLVCAAADARMGGSVLPAMCTMGDGNQGITAIIPVAVTARYLNASQEKMLRALALTHLISFYVKSNIGRTAPFCLCGLAAASGVAAAVTYLRDGTDEQIKGAVNNVLSSLAGILCDGAKAGCALKMNVATHTAFTASDLAMSGIYMGHYDGVADSTLEQTVKNISGLAEVSRSLLDNSMANIAIGKHHA